MKAGLNKNSFLWLGGELSEHIDFARPTEQSEQRNGSFLCQSNSMFHELIAILHWVSSQNNKLTSSPSWELTSSSRILTASDSIVSSVIGSSKIYNLLIKFDEDPVPNSTLREGKADGLSR